jgi:hypothetical protein
MLEDVRTEAGEAPAPEALAGPDDYPALFRAADTTAVRQQRRFLRATALSLALLVIAALAGAADITAGELRLTSIVAAVAFGFAILVRTYLMSSRADRKWYQARAAAETVKSLAWRYAVGGEPFPMSDAEADRKYVGRLQEALDELREVPLTVTGPAHQISERMRILRAAGLEHRRGVYAQGRVEDQWRWYADRSRALELRANWFGIGALVVEGGALCAAVVRAAGAYDFDLMGILAATAAAFVAWEQTAQDERNAAAYSVAAQQLAAIKMLVDGYTDESAWAGFVNNAEEAVSREHRLWLASRTSEERSMDA